MPKRVFIVDDDPLILEVLGRYISQAGHDVVTFTRFEDARAFLARHRPDVLLADVRLGAYNGIHLAVQARECYRGVRVVVFSAFDDAVLRDEAARCGATFALKPLSGPEVMSVVEEAAAHSVN